MKDIKSSSREHHWWPVGLQQHWSILGAVNSIDPSGEVQRKKYSNRRIAKKSHGHTVLRESEHWKTNFEGSFQVADNVADEVVKRLLPMTDFSSAVSILWTALKQRFRRELKLSDFSRYFVIDSDFRKKLVLLSISLLIRSPANRHMLERVGAQLGFVPHEETGKVNMLNQVRLMTDLYNGGFSGNIFPLVIFSNNKEFVFGDGLLDGMTSNAPSGSFRGHALIPLTPHICIFLSSTFSVRSDRNARLLLAPDWLVEQINDATQVYSKQYLFYSTQKPKLTNSFISAEHRQYSYHRTDTIEELIGMCGEPRQRQHLF